MIYILDKYALRILATYVVIIDYFTPKSWVNFMYSSIKCTKIYSKCCENYNLLLLPKLHCSHSVCKLDMVVLPPLDTGVM